MKNKATQVFNKARLAQDKKLSPTEIARFVDEFAKVVAGDEGRRKPISLRVPENLLKHFKLKARKEGSPYQTKIIELTRNYLL